MTALVARSFSFGASTFEEERNGEEEKGRAERVLTFDNDPAAVTVRMTSAHSTGIALVGRRWFRLVENYTADGKVDLSRSHYSINRRPVSRKRYRREMRRP
jgi:hypothetical protein